MRKLSQHIDATKYDIRGLWTGLNEDHRSSDTGVVEGYPFDPPDEQPGWFLVDYDVGIADGEADRYWTLWIREKTKARAKKARAKARAKRVEQVVASSTAVPATPRQPKERKERKPRKALRAQPEQPVPNDGVEEPN